MSDTALVRGGRVLAAYAVVASCVAASLYLGYGLAAELVQDWVLHGAVSGAAIGALAWLALRGQPRNAAVWVLLVSGVLQSSNVLALGIGQWRLAALGRASDWSLVVPAELPLGTALILQATTWLWIPGVFLLLTLGLLLFPDGRFDGPVWRWFGILGVVSITVGAACFVWVSRPSSRIPVFDEEVLLEAMLGSALRPVLVAAFGGAMLALVASLVAIVGRYRRSSGVVRQQFRWIGWGASLIVLSLSLFAITPFYGFDPVRYGAAVMLPAFIASYAIAVGRYRLYEIDRVVSRTAAYAVITATLGLVYVTLVLGLRTALAPFTDGSQLAVAVSTLAVVVAFRPVSARARALVDRRFNRTAYDARVAAAEFAQRLRDEVDLEAVRTELAAATSTTVQPVHVSVWLADASQGPAASAASDQ